MSTNERTDPRISESDQRTLRTARGLRAVAAALLVAGLVAAIFTELPTGATRASAANAPAEPVAPVTAPAEIDYRSGVTGTQSPEEFHDAMPTPPSIIVG